MPLVLNPRSKMSLGAGAAAVSGWQGGSRAVCVSCECQLLVHPTDLSSCEVSGSLSDWRPPMEVTMADSTNDLYQLQVSPLASSSEGGYFLFPSPVFQDEGVPGPTGETRAILQEKQPPPGRFGNLGVTKPTRVQKGRAGTCHLPVGERL